MMLDSLTVVMIAASMSIIMSGILFSVHRDMPPSIRGVARWAWGSFAAGVSGICFGGRGIFPDWISIIVANVGLLTGIALWLSGTQQFYERRETNRLILGIIAFGAGGIVWGLLVMPSYSLRLGVMTASLLCLYGSQLFLIVRYGFRHFSTFFLAATLVVQLVVLMVRGVTAALPGFSSGEFFSTDIIQIVYFATYAVVSLLLAVGYVMVATHRLNMELERHATRDALTGVINRRVFTEICEKNLRRSLRARQPFSVFILDLDHFKSINDRNGHAVGDTVLIEFCRKIESVLGPGATFARLGGEEFIIGAMDMSEAGSLELAGAIQAAVAARSDPFLPSYTCSIGIATTREPSAALGRLMAEADDALYLAKRAGRNVVKHGGAQWREADSGDVARPNAPMAP
ncbi:GGDEF domain-containing protein [Parapusillimonas granuli]|uniref:diguanylate cyclase n=1 Tax=Parapusillimonas granuli TaxID=380911 RepID=A0A853G0M9_9BURK|nr:GGDEF domain-containing protein [Parapusillimonas granuli]MBB5215894.1 diguanylate cyclase (GGDEF)-like protein [Parapusillimonas granuli]MEB2399415.1 GGDEF domain-containing protein [Alcaligenaceae bacterium]NYT50808.1 GGDEF domain-containing protein [Parapusillimonas granuli]